MSGVNTILLVVVLLILVGGGVWWYQQSQNQPEPAVQINLGSTE